MYRYDLEANKEIKLSDRPVRDFYVGKSGVYFVSDNYDPGIFKIGDDGKIVDLVKDRINSAMMLNSEVVYTMVYKEGIYHTK